MERFELTELAELPAVATKILAKAQARESDNGAVVLALSGDLGAGKTTFTQTLAEQLGVTDTVTSPTFVVMKGYETADEGFRQLIHIDAYRIEDVDEMRVLHFADILAQKNTIICIEWAERIKELLPADTISLNFTVTKSGRTITLND